MSSRGQSLSVFVVQRSFSRVRRGYDPDEVDRHLELVSQWFTSTEIGRALTRGRTELGERERAVAAREGELARGVEGARLEAEGTLEGARRRAQAAVQQSERTVAAARGREAAEDLCRRRAPKNRAARRCARAEAAAAEVIRAADERAPTGMRQSQASAQRRSAHRDARRRPDLLSDTGSRSAPVTESENAGGQAGYRADRAANGALRHRGKRRPLSSSSSRQPPVSTPMPSIRSGAPPEDPRRRPRRRSTPLPAASVAERTRNTGGARVSRA